MQEIGAQIVPTARRKREAVRDSLRALCDGARCVAAIHQTAPVAGAESGRPCLFVVSVASLIHRIFA